MCTYRLVLHIVLFTYSLSLTQTLTHTQNQVRICAVNYMRALRRHFKPFIEGLRVRTVQNGKQENPESKDEGGVSFDEYVRISISSLNQSNSHSKTYIIRTGTRGRWNEIVCGEMIRKSRQCVKSTIVQQRFTFTTQDAVQN